MATRHEGSKFMKFSNGQDLDIFVIIWPTLSLAQSVEEVNIRGRDRFLISNK